MTVLDAGDVASQKPAAPVHVELRERFGFAKVAGRAKAVPLLSSRADPLAPVWNPPSERAFLFKHSVQDALGGVARPSFAAGRSSRYRRWGIELVDELGFIDYSEAAILLEDMMRDLWRSLLIAFLIAALLEVPVMAAPTAPLGMVVQAQSALLDRAVAVGGATIYPGDKLETGSDGSAYLRIGLGQVYLLSSSAATLNSTSGGITAELLRGTAGFSSAAGESIELRTAQAVVRPKGLQPTNVRVTVIGPSQLVISTYSGAAELLVGDEVHALAENTSYRAEITRDQEPAPIGAGSKSVHTSHVWLVIIGAAVLTGVTIWGIKVALESPHHP